MENRHEIYMETIRLYLNHLRDYHNVMEEYLNSELERYNKEFDEILEQYRESALQSFQKLQPVDSQIFRYSNFSNRLRLSMIINSYSSLEYQMKMICDAVRIEKKQVFSIEDMGDDGIIGAKSYLSKVCELDFKNYPEWSFFHNIRRLRNRIIHHQSLFKKSHADITKFVMAHDSLAVYNNNDRFKYFQGEDLISYEFIINDARLNEEFIDKIESFFDQLLKDIYS